MHLSTILDPSCVVLDVGGGTKREVLARLAGPLAAFRADLDGNAILDELSHREEESSTAIADGIAIPHAKSNRPDIVTAAFGLSPAGVDFDSLDGKPTTLLMVLISPASSPEVHVTWLSHVARVLGDDATRKRLLGAASADEVLRVIDERENSLGHETQGNR